MGLILWIDQNTFASSLLEKVFKRRNQPFYTLSEAKDFLYLVEDLKPAMIVLDHSTAMRDLVPLKEQFEKSEALRQLPVIFIEDSTGLDFIPNNVGMIKRPFDPFKIPEMISSKLSQN